MHCCTKFHQNRSNSCGYIAFNNFQDGGCPPSWIFKNLIFWTAGMLWGTNMFHHTKFRQNQPNGFRDTAIFHDCTRQPTVSPCWAASSMTVDCWWPRLVASTIRVTAAHRPPCSSHCCCCTLVWRLTRDRPLSLHWTASTSAYLTPVLLFTRWRWYTTSSPIGAWTSWPWPKPGSLWTSRMPWNSTLRHGASKYRALATRLIDWEARQRCRHHSSKCLHRQATRQAVWVWGAGDAAHSAAHCVVCIYRPPGAVTQSFYQQFADLLDQLGQTMVCHMRRLQ